MDRKPSNPENRLSAEQLQFVEEIGLFFERMGMPRMAGRILGVLLIANPPAQSITELSLTLKASKSSISIMTRLLLETGLIERTASPVPRHDYFRFTPGGWILYMRQWLETMTALHQIAERGLSLIQDQPFDLQERLLEAHDLFSSLEGQFPTLLKDLEEERQRRTAVNRSSEGDAAH